MAQEKETSHVEASAGEFKPQDHLVTLRQGGGLYLPAGQRVRWFREKHPDWSIETTPLKMEVVDGYAVFQATIKNEHGTIMAMGTKMETQREFADFIEKAETGAVCRALSLCGFGEESIEGFEEAKGAGGSAGGSSGYRAGSGAASADSEDLPPCEGCGAKMTKAQIDYSTRAFGKPLCIKCQKTGKETP